MESPWVLKVKVSLSYKEPSILMLFVLDNLVKYIHVYMYFRIYKNYKS